MNKSLNTKELSQRWGLSTKTLERWRLEDKGPKFVKLGRYHNSEVRYPIPEIEAYEKEVIRGGMGRSRSRRNIG